MYVRMYLRMYACIHTCILHKIKHNYFAIQIYVHPYKVLYFILPLFSFFIGFVLYYIGDNRNVRVQADLELKAHCNNSGSEAHSNLQWNSTSLNKTQYYSDVCTNINFDYICYNLSSADDQVSTLIFLCVI